MKVYWMTQHGEVFLCNARKVKAVVAKMPEGSPYHWFADLVGTTVDAIEIAIGGKFVYVYDPEGKVAEKLAVPFNWDGVQTIMAASVTGSGEAPLSPDGGPLLPQPPARPTKGVEAVPMPKKPVPGPIKPPEVSATVEPSFSATHGEKGKSKSPAPQDD